ncbi:hypothetical protein KUCAC02_024912 [Chaenocephalus aceratus]|nr:hypothetical protein KUCAC02_024912 [Chaenocephalus aceratus]
MVPLASPRINRPAPSHHPGLVEQYVGTLLSLDPTPSPWPCWACVWTSAPRRKRSHHRETQAPQHILDRSSSFLRHVSHSEFKDLLLPTLQKTMLRSPENAMQTVFLPDLGSDSGPVSQLKANNGQLAEEAVQAMQNLAKQCSDPSAVQDIVTHLFQILGGSEGKLTVVAQKMWCVSGISSCSHHSVSGTSSQTLSSAVAVMFIPYLQQEVHEGTLVHAVSVLSQWSGRLTVEVPSALLDWLKKAFSLKTSTSSVRHAYLQTLLGAFRGDTLAQASDLVPRGSVVLLSRLALLETQSEAKFSNFWSLILDEKKPLLTTEKFLSQANDETLLTVLQLCERLFLDHAHRFNNNSQSHMYHRATVAVILSRSYRVRKRAQQTVRKLLSSHGGSSLAHGLLGELRVVINKQSVAAGRPGVGDRRADGGGAELQPSSSPIGRSVFGLLLHQPMGDSNEAEKIAMDTLIVAHHPSIVEVRNAIWPYLLNSMNIKTEEFIEKNLGGHSAGKNAVGALCVLSPTKVLPRVMSHVIEGLTRPALLHVTREEYAIMLTPEGELASKETTKKGNMKRENKAYSYKEQIIELELQAELNKKKGIKEELQLSSKQKEMIQAQQDREASIRKRLQLLDSDLQSAVGLLEAALIEKPSEITMELPAVLQVLLPLLPSPLAAPRLLRVYLDIACCLMPKHFHFLAELVGHVTLRLLKPECDLDPAWEQEDLETAANRTILLLHHHTVPQRDNKAADVAPLSAPAFSVCFPLLNAVVKKSSGSSEDEESQLIRALQVISEHCQLRSAADSDDMAIDENGPELLPRTSMLTLLIRVISTATPRLQVNNI